MNENIKIKERQLKYLDKEREYYLNQSWSIWKLLIITMKERNFTKN